MRRLWSDKQKLNFNESINNRYLIGVGILLFLSAVIWSPLGRTEDFVVYSVNRPLDLGAPYPTPDKDFFITMGSIHGLKEGSTVEVYRKAPTFDLINQKLFKDMTFPIAKLKIIHVESNAAIARLDKMNAPEKTASISPRTVMVGDIVKRP